MTRRSCWLAGAAAVALVVTTDLAVRAQLLPLPELAPVEGAEAPAEGTLAHDIERHPQCLERTNGCEVCVHSETARQSCSLPGIACQPSGWRCTRAGDLLPTLSPRL